MNNLTNSQLKVLSEIGVVTGQLSTGSMILPFVIPGLDDTKLPVIVLGLLTTSVSWLISVLVVRRIKS